MTRYSNNAMRQLLLWPVRVVCFLPLYALGIGALLAPCGLFLLIPDGTPMRGLWIFLVLLYVLYVQLLGWLLNSVDGLCKKWAITRWPLNCFRRYLDFIDGS